MQTYTHFMRAAASFGKITLSDGTELLGELPRVGASAYLHVIFSALDVKDLEGLEAKLHRPVPAPLAKFLLRHNGLIAYQGALAISGYRRDFSRDPSKRQPFDILEGNTYSRVPGACAGDFFIGSYNWDGSLLYLRDDSIKVFRRSKRDPAVLNIWPSLDQMLNEEVLRISLLFDEFGHEKSEDMPTSPKANN